MLAGLTRRGRLAAAARPAGPALGALARGWAAPALARGRCAPPAGAAGPAADASPSGAVHEAPEHASLLFESPVYGRFVNMMMKSGKKQVAQRKLWATVSRLRDAGHDPQAVLYGALDNVRPMVEMKTVPGQKGPVPYPLNPHRAEGIAMKWIIGAARKGGGTTFDARLMRELLAAHQFKGGAMQKRDEMHKTALANQAAAHFRWRAGASRPAGSVDMDRKRYRPQGRRAIKRFQGAFG